MESDVAYRIAIALNGNGGCKDIALEEALSHSPEDGNIWIHIDFNDEEGRRWLLEQASLPRLVGISLLAEETRPRCVNMKEGMLVFLRGVNFNPGAEPSDMVSIRMWMDSSRVITVQKEFVRSVKNVAQTLRDGNGPKNSGQVLVYLCEQIARGISELTLELDDGIDALEDQSLHSSDLKLRSSISRLRREIITARRHVSPIRDAINLLHLEQNAWLDANCKMQLREIGARITRYVEDLDSARDRGAVTQDELSDRLSERMNKAMYLMSVVAAVFLPLSLLTGLLGINVGGIPGSDNSFAFATVCIILVVIALFQTLIFKWMKWL